MTQTLPDYDSTGEIPTPHPLRHTEIIDIGVQHTAVLNLPDETQALPAWSPIRHQIDETAVIGVLPTATMGLADDGLDLLGYDQGGYPPVPPPLPPAPKRATWTDQVGEFPTVRPAVPRERTERDPGRHRAGAPWRFVAVLTVGLTLLAELAAIGVSALLGVQW